ncbi:MAG: methyltransferase domain-containing protein [Microcystis sp.]|jgi:SAM-dependent methyltransferase|uniref:methyltransferase domain-containing protein n=1 Tax=Microcystis sp. TaxID=1127 RepID=UPI00391D5512
MLELKRFLKDILNKIFVGQELRWKLGAYFETRFWYLLLQGKGQKSFTDELYGRLDPHFPFQEHLKKYVNQESKKLKILDVGAGPVSVLGSYWPDGPEIDIYPIDPLADKYDLILQKVKLNPKARTILCYGEKITEKFPLSFFDLVHARNSLDHSYDPIKCFQEMLAVLKEDGYIYTGHSRNEGEKENYGGFHQWNFDIIDSNFCIWNKNSRYFLKDYLPSGSQIITEFDQESDWITLVLPNLHCRKFLKLPLCPAML